MYLNDDVPAQTIGGLDDKVFWTGNHLRDAFRRATRREMVGTSMKPSLDTQNVSCGVPLAGKAWGGSPLVLHKQ